jgi:hypothetical protein
MPIQDYFVGFAAGAVGLFFMLGAALDAAWLMDLRRPRLLAASIGKTAARWTLGLLGVGLIAVGVVIASGWRVDWSWLGSGRPPAARTQLFCRLQ